MFFRRARLCVFAVGVLCCALAGCPNSTPPTAPAAKGGGKSAPLKLLVVDDAALGQAIAREWQSRTEGELDLQNVSQADIASASRLPGDVVICASGSVGQLAERDLISRLDEAALAEGEFDRRDIFDQVRLREMVWGNKTVAVPLGSPRLLLVYRRDVFEELSLSPPRDWKEYQAAVDRLAEGGLPDRVAIEPLASGWAGQVLLARAAAYVTHRDQVSPLFDYLSLEPLITSAPYVRALEELIAARKGGTTAPRLTPAEAWTEIRSGRAAMAFTWPPASEKSASSDSHLAFAQLPGASEVYNFSLQKWDERESGDEAHVPLLVVSGRMACVTSTATDARAAQSFLAWLGGGEVSTAVAPASDATTIFRDSQLPSAGRWTGGLDAATAKSYGETLQTSTKLQRFVSLRLPGRDEYLAALDTAVEQSVADDVSAADALATAAAKWREITARIGLESQRRALRRDLGLESLP